MSGCTGACRSPYGACPPPDFCINPRASATSSPPIERAEPRPIAYLYHDAPSAEAADPMLHSTLVVLAADRRPNCRNETALYAHPPTTRKPT
jgi:hypothetical protein